MTRIDNSPFEVRWTRFVRELRVAIDVSCRNAESRSLIWQKTDGSSVTALDLRLDIQIRECLIRHFPEAAVLSEEIGLLTPAEDTAEQVAVVDPIDGTESLIAGQNRWWVSIGLRNQSGKTAGIIYQPTTGRIHDSAHPMAHASNEYIIGMSPDRLTARATLPIRTDLINSGAALIETPHAVEKVAAVLEGRAVATIYLPSSKSPVWHSWDLAAGVALARANGMCLQTLDGRSIALDDTNAEYTTPWICAADERVWNSVGELLGRYL